MRLKLISVAFGAAIALSSFGAAFAAPAPKISMCHHTGGQNWRSVFVIEVSANAIGGHGAHNDVFRISDPLCN